MLCNFGGRGNLLDSIYKFVPVELVRGSYKALAGNCSVERRSKVDACNIGNINVPF
jgi:hypothetical protein